MIALVRDRKVCFYLHQLWFLFDGSVCLKSSFPFQGILFSVLLPLGTLCWSFWGFLFLGQCHFFLLPLRLEPSPSGFSKYLSTMLHHIFSFCHLHFCLAQLSLFPLLLSSIAKSCNIVIGLAHLPCANKVYQCPEQGNGVSGAVQLGKQIPAGD